MMKTRFFDPNYHKQNFRDVFDFPPDSVFDSNIRLCNVGQYGANTQYNSASGSLGSIESIQLMDGAGTVLDQIFDYSLYQTFKNINSKNNDDIASLNYLRNNAVGKMATGIENTTNSGIKIKSVNLKNNISIASNEEYQGWLSLRDCLPFLRSSEYLPTNLFTQLRLIINWKNSTDLKNNAVDSTGTYLTPPAPFLIVDEVVDEGMKMQIMKEYGTVQFTTIENERVSMNAVSGLADTVDGQEKTQSESFLLNGFNNKTVGRMLIIRSPTDTTTWRENTNNVGPANQSSFSVYKPVIQPVINGKTIFPGSGLTKKNHILGLMSDTWGDLAVSIGSNLTGFTNAHKYYDNPASDVGKYDYTGWIIDNKVKEMKLQVARNGVYGLAVISNNVTPINPLTAITVNIQTATQLYLMYTSSIIANLSTGINITTAGIAGLTAQGDVNGTGQLLKFGHVNVSKGVLVGNNNPIVSMTVSGDNMVVKFTNAVNTQCARGDMIFFSGITGMTALAGVNGNGQVFAVGLNDFSKGANVGNTNPITAVTKVAVNTLKYTFTADVSAVCQVGVPITIAGIVNNGGPAVGPLNGTGIITVVDNGNLDVTVLFNPALNPDPTVGNALNLANAVATVGSNDTLTITNIGTGVTVGNTPNYGSAIVNNGDDKIILVSALGNGVTVGNAPNFANATTTAGIDGNKIINQAMDLRLFGEVEKAIVPNSQGGYNVVYV